jgi:hypothetical protein
VGFVHPASGEWLECRAPLPADLEQLLATLRRAACAAGVSKEARQVIHL